MQKPDGSVHFSRLKLINESAAHYRDNIGPEDSPELRKGSGLHAYMIGDKSQIAVCDIARNPKHAAYREFLAEHQGQDILSRSEFANVQQMRAALERHPRAMELLEGERERTIDWRYLGRRCRGTPDVYRPNERLVELKTMKSTNPKKARFDIAQRFYHSQLAWYAEGLERNGIVCPEKYIVAVAKTAPYLVVCFRLTPRAVEAGAKIVRLWMEQLKQCELAKYWPGYSEADVEFDITDEAGKFADASNEVEILEELEVA